MNKVTFENATIEVVLQHSEELSVDNCSTGVISVGEDGNLKFEEEIRKGRAPRNPKLFDGDYVSMVRMQNGKYQFHMKTLNAEAGIDGREIAKAVSREIVKAFKFINA